jgi:hypothetical protein
VSHSKEVGVGDELGLSGAGHSEVDGGASVVAKKRASGRQKRKALHESMTLEDWGGLDEEEVYADTDAIFKRWIDIKVVLTRQRFCWEAEWIRGELRLSAYVHTHARAAYDP